MSACRTDVYPGRGLAFYLEQVIRHRLLFLLFLGERSFGGLPRPAGGVPLLDTWVLVANMYLRQGGCFGEG